ncbi:hypothetical protein D3C71_1466820 [compost metagenome]
MRDAGVPGQQQTLGGPHTQAYTGTFTLHTRPLAVVIGKQAHAVGQAHFTQHAALTLQCAFQLTQVRLHLTFGRQVLHQHFQHAATGQADARTRVAAIAITHDGHWLGKLPPAHALEKVVFDAATGQRTQPLPAGVHRQQRARRTGRRAIGGEHRAQPHPLAAARPLQRLADHL